MKSIPLATAHAAPITVVSPYIPPRYGLQLPGQVDQPAPPRIPPEVTTKARSLPGQISSERIYGPRPTPAQPLPSHSGLMLSGEVEPQAAALGQLPATPH